MSTDECLASLAHRDWLADGPLNCITASHIEALCAQHYAEYTISAYLRCLAHFGYWMKNEGLHLSSIAPTLIVRFLQRHLPACTCPAPCQPLSLTQERHSGSCHRNPRVGRRAMPKECLLTLKNK